MQFISGCDDSFFFYVLTGEINCMAVLINQTQINEEFKFTPV